MSIRNFEDLFVDQISDLLNAESQLVKALPLMAQGATDPELKNAFDSHLQETRTHLDRLKQVCSEIDISPPSKRCKAMEGLVAEAEEYLNGDLPSDVKDAALIAAAQRVEHYEISAYGTARTFAEDLGFESAADLLQETLDEESNANETLNDLAMSRINADAANAANM